MSDKNWSLSYSDVATGVKNYGRESLLSLGNGYFGWRGALVVNDYSEDSYPGLYIAGVFNQTTTPVAGKSVINEDLVNLPNIQRLAVMIDGNPLVFNTDTIKKIEQTLDYQTGMLTDTFRVQVDNDISQFIDIKTVKVVDPINWHSLGLRVTLTPSYDVEIQIDSQIDGNISNQNVARYRQFDAEEFEISDIEQGLMQLQTKTTDINIAIASKSSVDRPADKQINTEGNRLTDSYTLHLDANQSVTLDKVVALATSLEMPTDRVTFVKNIIDTTSYDQMMNNSHNYWQAFWQDKDIEISGDQAMQRLTRMNIFHLNQMANPNANTHLDASVGSRGLTGEGYRGHIFWDELFVLPYYSANEPEMARSILNYRIRRLTAAHKNAESEGEVGAMYPWQSGMYGDEQSQLIHLNTVNQTWIPDNSRLQRHVSLAIAYNMWVYQQTTGLTDHLEDGGLDMLIDITKFWVNKAQKEGSRYSIAGVMGPNEFHEAIPGHEQGGLLNNSYTNLMVVWLLNYIHELSEQTNFQSVAQKVGYSIEEQAKAEQLRHQLKLSIDSEGIVEQYEGFFNLKPLDFNAYMTKYGDIHRIDRLLKAEGQSPDDFQVIKQADFLMLLYNFGAEHTKRLITQLGYELPKDWLEKNTAYYLARTTHGSTTSRPVFAGIYVELARQGNSAFENTAYDFLTDAIGSDYYDIQGGTTAEGVHMGVMGETLSVIQNDYAGVDVLHGQFSINPKLPKSWENMRFTQKYHGATIKLHITHELLTLTTDKAMTVKVAGKQINLEANEMKEVSYYG